MDHTTKKEESSDKIFFMDEMNDEIAQPLTPNSKDTNVVIEPRTQPLLEANDLGSSKDLKHLNGPMLDNLRIDSDNTQPESELDLDDFKPDFITSRIGDSTPGINDELLPDGPISPSAPTYPPGAFPGPPVQSIPDVNIYQHKKTLAQGMMDLALLSANANQLRYVLQTDGRHPYYYPSLAMIGASLFLQIAVGIGLIWNSRYNVKDDAQMCKANKANNWTVIGIFLVTILNVFISSFGVVDQTTPLTT